MKTLFDLIIPAAISIIVVAILLMLTSCELTVNPDGSRTYKLDAETVVEIINEK